MELTPKNSRKYLVNLLSDFILSKIPKTEKTKIEIADCENFFIIKGQTTSKEILNLNELKNDFFSNYPELKDEKKLINTIDLIEYNVELKSLKEITFTYYNSDNCSYPQKNIDSNSNKSSNELIIKSNFPFGHSLDMGRLLYYYGKHIIYNIPSNYPFDTLTLTISTNNTEENFKVYDGQSNELEHLKSAILDCFDFNVSWIENEIKKMDWSVEITNPLEDYELLKKKVKDFIII